MNAGFFIFISIVFGSIFVNENETMPVKPLFQQVILSHEDTIKVPLNDDSYQEIEKNVIAMLKTRLADTLYYHSVEHTIDVVYQATRLGKLDSLNNRDLLLLKISALFHDTGFIFSPVNHEEKGVKIAQEMLEKIDLSIEDYHQIEQAILATKIPQKPNSRLGEILCDADLDYLGRPEVAEIAERLYKELQAMGKVNDRQKWNEMQVSFISKHHYFTTYNQGDREPKKQIYLNSVISALKSKQ